MTSEKVNIPKNRPAKPFPNENIVSLDFAKLDSLSQTALLQDLEIVEKLAAMDTKITGPDRPNLTATYFYNCVFYQFITFELNIPELFDPNDLFEPDKLLISFPTDWKGITTIDLSQVNLTLDQRANILYFFANLALFSDHTFAHHYYLGNFWPLKRANPHSFFQRLPYAVKKPTQPFNVMFHELATDLMLINGYDNYEDAKNHAWYIKDTFTSSDA